jgi:hypothetical protein
VTKENESKLFTGPIVYLWLALSLLLNVSGIASIVDGFVHWANFFKDFLDIYRAWIREPLSWAVHLVWPSWWPMIPPWVFDLLVIWSAFIFGFNVGVIRNSGRSIFSVICDSVKDFFFGLAYIVAWPLILLIFFLGNDKYHGVAWEWLTYTAVVFATVIVLMFLNWQFQHIGQ